MAKNMTQAGETTIAGLARDDTPRHLKLDTSTHTLQTIDYAHHEVHAGSRFFYTDANTVAGSTDVTFIIETPDTTEYAHFMFEATGSAITEVNLWEGGTWTGTTDVASYNNNRNSTDSASVTIYKGIASTDYAASPTETRLWTHKSGSATAQSRGNMIADNGQEIILKRDTKYMLRVGSGTDGNLTNVKFEWYEHTDRS